MGCGATKAQHEEEDEYYEEESRSVQTSARLLNRGVTPMPPTKDDSLEKSADEGRHSKSIESDKWDTFEIESSTTGNTANGRIKSAERLLIKEQFAHPNRVVSATRKNRRSPSPRRYRSPSPRRERRSSLSPPRSNRRESMDDSIDRRRRYDSNPREYNRKSNPHHHTDQRRPTSRGYESDVEDYEKRRRRVASEHAKRRMEEDYDEGYKSDNRRGPPNGYQRPPPPIHHKDSSSSGDSGRYQPRRQQPAPNMPANRNYGNAYPQQIKSRPHSEGDVPTAGAGNPNNRSPNKSNQKTGSIAKQQIPPPHSKPISRDMNNQLRSPRMAPKKPISGNASPTKVIATTQSKPGQNGAPPPWRLSYGSQKPAWAT